MNTEARLTHGPCVAGDISIHAAIEASGIDRLLSGPETRAALGGISRTTLYELLGSGALESVKIGRRRLVKASSVARLAREGWEA